MALSDSPTRAPHFRRQGLLRRFATAPSAEFLQRAGRAFVAIGAIAYLFDLLQQTRDGLTNGAGRPFGDDFINFWSGPFLAWHQRAAEIYHPAAFHAFEQSVVGAPLDGYHYSYPPMLLVLTLPLALIPYVPALGLWLAAGWFAFYRALRLAMPEGRTLLLALATPAVLVNAVGGQNGTFTAALFGGGLGLLDRRPLIGGALLGLLIYKPHLGILIPLALLAGRRWRATAAATASAAGLIAVSLAWLGPDIFADYLREITALRHAVLEDGTGVWHRMISVFVAARRLGADVATAYAVQAAVGAVCALAVAAVWFRSAPFGVRNAVLVLGTCLATPYLQDYDLVCGAVVAAWLTQDAVLRSSSQFPLFAANAGILLVPLLAAPLAHLSGLALGPLFILPAFALALTSALASAPATRPA